MRITCCVSPSSSSRSCCPCAPPGRARRRSARLSPICSRRIPNGSSSIKFVASHPSRFVLTKSWEGKGRDFFPPINLKFRNNLFRIASGSLQGLSLAFHLSLIHRVGFGIPSTSLNSNPPPNWLDRNPIPVIPFNSHQDFSGSLQGLSLAYHLSMIHRVGFGIPFPSLNSNTLPPPLLNWLNGNPIPVIPFKSYQDFSGSFLPKRTGTDEVCLNAGGLRFANDQPTESVGRKDQHLPDGALRNRIFTRHRVPHQLRTITTRAARRSPRSTSTQLSY